MKCLYCGKELVKWQKKYCSNKCSGKISAETNRLNKTGFFNSKLQSELGKRAAEVNRKKGTSVFFDKKLQSEMGKRGIITNKKNKTGFVGMTFEQRSQNGKKAVETNRRNKSSFFNPETHKNILKNQKINKTGFFNPYFIMPKKDTSIEVKIQNFLKLLGIEFFTHQYISEIKHAYRCDILIPSAKTIIECDGDYWHGNKKMHPNLEDWQLERIERDNARTQELIEKGYRVIRLWEHEIRELTLEDFKNKLLNSYN